MPRRLLVRLVRRLDASSDGSTLPQLDAVRLELERELIEETTATSVIRRPPLVLVVHEGGREASPR